MKHNEITKLTTKLEELEKTVSKLSNTIERNKEIDRFTKINRIIRTKSYEMKYWSRADLNDALALLSSETPLPVFLTNRDYISAQMGEKKNELINLIAAANLN